MGGITSTSGQGRPKGTPNKATADARKAIGAFVDGNADRLQGWLDAVANGVKIQNPDGSEEYVVAPNPEKAFALFQSVVEYHVPKLQRSEVNATVAAAQLTREEIDARLSAMGVVIK